MSDLPIVFAFLAGSLTGYLIGRSRKATEFDLLRLEFAKTKDHLNTLRRIYGMDEQK